MARALDWQRRLKTKQGDWPVRLSRFGFEAIPNLGTAEIPFFSPLTVLCGPNGVGKTTLLRALWATLDPKSAATTIDDDRKLSSGSSTAEMILNGESVSATVEYTSRGLREVVSQPVTAVHIDSASETRVQQKAFAAFDGAEELTNGVGVRDLSDAELAEVNYILNRDYRKISLYEVELDGIAPFFEVSYGADNYDSRTMGTGELSALNIWWALDRAERKSLVLIEEPEAFLSAACQANLVDVLISKVVQKQICAVISSHSNSIVTSMPKESLCYVARGQGGMQILPDRAPPIFFKSIGIDPPILAFAFVEDVVAAGFLKLLLERVNAHLARRVAIEVRGGEAEITAALRLTSGFTSAMRFLGLYDGDMRDSIPNDLADCSIALPGEVSLEEAFRRLAAAKPEALASAFHRDDLNIILAGLEGRNDHDWYEELAKELGLTKSQLIPTMFEVWIAEGENASAAAVCYEELVGRLNFED